MWKFYQLLKFCICRPKQCRTQEKISGVQGYGRPRRGSGGVAPGTPENFRKFAKIFIKKIAKNALFWPTFQRKFKKPSVKFSRVWAKNNLVGKFWEKFDFFDNNSIENWLFYLFWWKFVAKNRAFGNKIIFLQQFFPVQRVWTS